MGNHGARISGLYVYPLKSAAGIPLDSAELDDFGIRHDRRWMVIAESGEFLTQRDVPTLSLVRTSFEDGMLKLDAPGALPIRLPLHGPAGERRSVGVWRDVTEGVDCGDDVAKWISAALRTPARILFMPDEVVRLVDRHYATGDERVSFADGFPLLLITQASLDELNSRLERPLPMNRFRPNLVVDGTTPHAEDEWRRIAAGNVELTVVKPCARCVTTTVDQQTGVPGKEPLRTLATYRKVGSSVMFGQNVIHTGPGTLTLGSRVAILELAAAPGITV